MSRLLARYVKECTELMLAHRGIERLGGFERLTNLEVLFVNDNKLRHLTHLEQVRGLRAPGSPSRASGVFPSLPFFFSRPPS